MQVQRPNPQQFSVQEILDAQCEQLAKIERSVATIKGWVIFFGICALAGAALMMIAAAGLTGA